MQNILIFVIFYISVFFNNIQIQDNIINSNEFNMPVNNVLSGDGGGLTYENFESLPDYLSSPFFGFTFIKPDNSLWLCTYINEMYPKKVSENVISVKSNVFYHNIVIMKTDNSVWVSDSFDSFVTEESLLLKKICDNAKMIELEAVKNTIFILKNDNSLWSYENNINKKKDENLTKIMDNVSYIKIPSSDQFSAQIKENSFYMLIIKSDYSLWQYEIYSDEPLIKIADNIICADISKNIGLLIKNNNDVFIWDCKKISDKKDLVKLTDNAKYVKIGENLYIYVLKNDNTLYRYNHHLNLELEYMDFLDYKIQGKLSDDIVDILGDNTLFFKSKSNEILYIDFDNKLENNTIVPDTSKPIKKIFPYEIKLE